MEKHSQGDPHVFPIGRKPGELLFCMAFLVFGGVLLALIGQETTWLNGKGLAAQPRTWPAISLGGMFLFALVNWYRASKVMRTPGRWQEASVWIRSIEYMGWYLVYVFSVPVIGYLLATLIFCLSLTWRVGYRSRLMFISAAGFAVFVVLFFKTFLNVKIPGGAIYDLLPEGLRYIMFRYF